MSMVEKVSMKIVARFFVEVYCWGRNQIVLTLNFFIFFPSLACVMFCTNKLPWVAQALSPVCKIEGGCMAENHNNIKMSFFPHGYLRRIQQFNLNCERDKLSWKSLDHLLHFLHIIRTEAISKFIIQHKVYF